MYVRQVARGSRGERADHLGDGGVDGAPRGRDDARDPGAPGAASQRVTESDRAHSRCVSSEVITENLPILMVDNVLVVNSLLSFYAVSKKCCAK